MRACAVVPTYRNPATVADVVRRTLPHVDEVLVVDDGSGDGTGEAARAAGATVVSHAWNRGKGEALATGLLHAWRRGYTHAVTIDADGQHFPEDIPALLEAARGASGAPGAQDAIVVGARPMAEAANVPGASRFGRVFSNFWVWLEGGVRVDDSQSGFRVYPVATTRALPMRSSRYDWEVEVLVRAGWAGLPVRSVPIRVHYPPAGERVSHFRMFRDNVRISWLNVRLLATLLLSPGLLLRRAGLLAHAPAPAVPDAAAPLDSDAGTGVRARPAAWSGRSYGGRVGHAIWAGALRLLGVAPVRFLMVFVVAWYWLVARAAVAASRDYLRRLRGRSAGGAETYRHLYTFASAIADKLLLLVRGPASFAVERAEDVARMVDEAAGAGRGVVLLTAHAGSWEVASAVLAVVRPALRVHLVLYRGEEARLAEFLDRLGENVPRPRVIAVGEDEMTAVRLIAALRAGDCLAMMGDRFLDAKGRGVVRVPFLGAPAAFPTAPYALAAITGAAVVPVFGFMERSRRYRLEGGPPRTFRFDERAARAAVLRDGAAWYAEVVEAHLRRWPYQWYNFYDFWR